MELDPLNRPARRPASPSRAAWSALGVAVAVILVIGGLAIGGAIVAFVVGMSHFGSNK
jgi:energy-converting hydrogenase Eha subunit A